MDENTIRSSALISHGHKAKVAAKRVVGKVESPRVPAICGRTLALVNLGLVAGIRTM